MKLLGLSDGRPMGNSEVLLKEAMMAAEEVVKGLEVEIIRLQLLTIKPCLGCFKCADPARQDRDWKCVLKNDHMEYLCSKLSEADGIILSNPAYLISAPSIIFAIRDRINSGHIERKPRVAGYIAVGGSDFMNLCLPLMPIGFGIISKKVDQMFVPFTACLGQVVLNKEAMARARKLGRNVGKAMKMPFDKVEYVGEAMKVSDAEVKYLSGTMDVPEDYVESVVREEDHCPVCHSNLLNLQGKYVKCAVCDVRGEIKIVGDKVTVTYDEAGLKRVRHGPIEGPRHQHLVRHSMKLYSENKKEIEEKVQKYRGYGNITAPPAFTGQKPIKLIEHMKDRQAFQ